MAGLHLIAFLGATLAGPPAGGAVEIELEWSAPASCPRADEVRTQIDELLPSEVDTPLQLSVRALVHETGGAYELELAMELADAHDERRVRAASCPDLARATALVVATMIDPIAVADRLDAAQARTGEREVEVVEPPAEPEASASTPEAPLAAVAPPTDLARMRARVRPVATLRLDALAGAATLPRVDAGLALSAGVVLSRARVELGLAHVFAQRRDHPSIPGVALRVRGTMAVVRACGVPAFGAWELPLCGGAEVGALAARAEGDAVSGASLVRSPYAAAFVEAHAAWRATRRFAVWIGVQGLAAIVRPRFTVADLDPFVRTAWGGGRAKLGVEVRF
jgi:hypothetical protein